MTAGRVVAVTIVGIEMNVVVGIMPCSHDTERDQDSSDNCGNGVDQKHVRVMCDEQQVYVFRR